MTDFARSVELLADALGAESVHRVLDLELSFRAEADQLLALACDPARASLERRIATSLSMACRLLADVGLLLRQGDTPGAIEALDLGIWWQRHASEVAKTAT